MKKILLNCLFLIGYVSAQEDAILAGELTEWDVAVKEITQAENEGFKFLYAPQKHVIQPIVSLQKDFKKKVVWVHAHDAVSKSIYESLKSHPKTITPGKLKAPLYEMSVLGMLMAECARDKGQDDVSCVELEMRYKNAKKEYLNLKK